MDRRRSPRLEELLRYVVAPVTERAHSGELHDVPLVHERDALALVDDGVADGAVNEPLAPEIADQLQSRQPAPGLHGQAPQWLRAVPAILARPASCQNESS